MSPGLLAVGTATGRPTGGALSQVVRRFRPMTSLSAGPRVRTSFECSSCGAPHPTWVGRCGTCGDWNALVEVPVGRSGLAPGSNLILEVGEARPMSALSPDASGAVPTGIAEVDRAFGGGLVPGSVTLVGGAAGVGYGCVFGVGGGL